MTGPYDRFTLSRLRRRDALIGALGCVVAATAVALEPRRMFEVLDRKALEAAIPTRFGDYSVTAVSGLILPPADEISKEIYDEVLARIYTSSEDLPIMAVFAYGSVQNLTLELHRPEKCYPEQGFTLSEPTYVPFAFGGRNVEATFLSAVRENYHEQVLYWTRIGQAFPTTSWDEKILVARQNLNRVMPDGMLVRISVASVDQRFALAQIHSFVNALMANLPPLGQQLLIGTTV